MIFDFGRLFRDTLSGFGFDPCIVLNTYDPGHDPIRGWPLKLPQIEFDKNTLLVLNLQDWMTYRDGTWLELKHIEQMYHKHCDQVVAIHWPHDLSRYYHGPVNLLEFNVHETAIIGHLVDTQHVWRPAVSAPKDIAWQCLNGRRCPHRLRVVQRLEHECNGILSYSDVIKLDTWPYNTYRGTENEDNFLRLLPVYSRAAVNIVTETIYNDPVGIVTEKTILALLSCQIPIVIGYQGIVDDCRSLGFDMFDDLVDTSYDTLPNDQRAEAAIAANIDLIQGRIDLLPYQERLRRQQEYVLDQWILDITERFQNQCRSLSSRLLSR